MNRDSRSKRRLHRPWPLHSSGQRPGPPAGRHATEPLQSARLGHLQRPPKRRGQSLPDRATPETNSLTMSLFLDSPWIHHVFFRKLNNICHLSIHTNIIALEKGCRLPSKVLAQIAKLPHYSKPPAIDAIPNSCSGKSIGGISK